MAKQAADIRTRMSTTDERFAVMDEMGVDMQLVCPAPPQIYYYLPLDVGVQAARALNDGIAEYVGKHKDRLVALGGVPMQDGNEAAKELERCMKTLKLQGRRDSHQRQRQGAVRSGIRAVLEKGRGARRAGADPSDRLHPAAAFRALLLQQRHRQSARYHDGAALSDLRRRVRTPSQAARAGRARRRFPRRLFGPHRSCLGRALGLRTATCRKPPTTYLRRNVYLDTVVFTPHQLEALVKTYGADRIVLGTDYPVRHAGVRSDRPCRVG